MNLKQSNRRLRTWPLAIAACLLVAAFGAPAASAASAPPLNKGFWGPTEIDGTSMFPTYEKLGVTIYQTSLSWNTIALTRPANPKDPNDPAYQWPVEIDQIIAEARQHHMSVMLMLVGTPPWANGGKTSDWAPDKSADFAAFARAATRRYPAVRRWMIWGEPSRSNNWKPTTFQKFGQPVNDEIRSIVERYARLLDAAYGQLKAQHKSNLVIGGNTYITGDIRPIDWAQSMKLPNGKPPRMDLYGHNPFSIREPNLRNAATPQGQVDFSDLGRFDKIIQKSLGRPRHKHIRLYLSEFAIPTEAPDLELNFYVTLKTQAKWITSAFKVAREVGVDTLGWIRLRDDLPTPAVEAQGGLTKYDLKPKPGFYAFMRGALPPAQRAKERKAARSAEVKRERQP